MSIDRGQGPRATLQTAAGTVTYFPLAALQDRVGGDLDRLPITIKVLLEALVRHAGNGVVREQDIASLAGWSPSAPGGEFPCYPARVLLQDFTGVPAVVDLAALRSAMARLGGDPQRVNPVVPADLVIDHSVQVDFFANVDAFRLNVEREYERNGERYALLRWTQEAFKNFRVVPPGRGIVHQVNLEYLASVVHTERDAAGQAVAYPDSLVGTDSHTTMVNGLGVLGWGVGGIEAEAVLLGQPLYLLAPEVVGFRFVGQLPEGATATDLVLTVTELLRKKGVVGRFVEFTGPGLSQLGLADRATISNMCPEYGATAALFPVDDETLRYLRMTGRDSSQIDLVERYCKTQGLFRTDDQREPGFTDQLELDLATVEPSLAGPRRPQDRVGLASVGESIRAAYPAQFPETNGHNGHPPSPSRSRSAASRARLPTVRWRSRPSPAAPTPPTRWSCSAPGCSPARLSRRGYRCRPTVKTSMAPGSRVVTDYLQRAGLLPYLEALQFHTVGYGCTTCIGNSGPLPDPVAQAVRTISWWSRRCCRGNRNFEGRIHPQVRASYLASPPLVVAFALAGTVDIDLVHDPIGADRNGAPVYLRELWPTHRRDPRGARRRAEPRAIPDASTPRSSRATSTGRRCHCPIRASSSTGSQTRPTCASQPTSRV